MPCCRTCRAHGMIHSQASNRVTPCVCGLVYLAELQLRGGKHELAAQTLDSVDPLALNSKEREALAAELANAAELRVPLQPAPIRRFAAPQTGGRVLPAANHRNGCCTRCTTVQREPHARLLPWH